MLCGTPAQRLAGGAWQNYFRVGNSEIMAQGPRNEETVMWYLCDFGSLQEELGARSSARLDRGVMRCQGDGTGVNRYCNENSG